MKTQLYIPVLAAALLSSCLVGPDFVGAPQPELPVTWVNALPPASDQESLIEWWASFRDPQLNELLNRGFTANPDMMTAALAIFSAESQLRARGADLLPSLSGNFGGTHSGTYNSSATTGKWNGGLSASWTPDIWGGTRREVEAAFASLGSTHAAANATRTALASSIATTYFEWISAQESLRIAREQLAYQERTYEVTKKRRDADFASNLDLAEAEATIASTRAQIPTYEANIRSCENALATYLGTTVDQIKLTMPGAATYNRIPRVPTGLPSELLRRRPDIIRAEYQLHEATANIGVQVANLFPRLSLTGSTSASSGSDFTNFFRSAGWSLVGSVSQTLLNRTALNESVTMAELAEMSAAESYRKTVLAAFAEVEDCLIEYAQLTEQLPAYEASCKANKTAAELSLRRFSAGESDFLNVAAAERAWLSAELNIISTRQRIRMALARLCTAMGGGY